MGELIKCLLYTIFKLLSFSFGSTQSPAAYEALKGFGILSLPAKSTLQAYSGAFIHAPGASTACLADQVA